jgi:Nucleotidyl transferase AbiEii toxin, Type IV TA system
MRLFEHPDYRDLIVAAARDGALPEAFVEKDHWITEVLRAAQATLPGRLVFKGGTSLSKGWELIRRFSEDVDLFVDPEVEPSLGGRGIDRALRRLRDEVARIPGLALVEPASGQSRTKKGRERSDDFAYTSVFPEDGRVPPTVRLEAGIQSGRQPTEHRMITSLLARYISSHPEVAAALGELPELESFQMQLLAFRRTFVEKLFAIHGKVARCAAEGVDPGRDVRHYADLYFLAGQPDVQAMLASEEYRELRHDYDANSRRFYAGVYRPPADPDLRFRASDALFPDEALRAVLEPAYERECRVLFDGPYPSFTEVLARFQALRDRL